MKLISIGQAALLLGVCVSTLRRWEKAGYFSSSCRTPGGHRRYDIKALQAAFLGINEPKESKIVVGYARVSSHDQLADLERQIDRLKEACQSIGSNYKIITDCGSGINYNKKGLGTLLGMILRREINTLVLTHRDRLLRFGSQLLFMICEFSDVAVVVLDEKQDISFEQQLAQDLIELITVFSSRVYGRRAQDNRRRRQAKAA
jgi:putative resolvase